MWESVVAKPFQTNRLAVLEIGPIYDGLTSLGKTLGVATHVLVSAGRG